MEKILEQLRLGGFCVTDSNGKRVLAIPIDMPRILLVEDDPAHPLSRDLLDKAVSSNMPISTGVDGYALSSVLRVRQEGKFKDTLVYAIQYFHIINDPNMLSLIDNAR